ncbi:MAG: type II toxin-antitoxin system prevent-host-death family antitoxin [Pseudomonadota bacterium]
MAEFDHVIPVSKAKKDLLGILKQMTEDGAVIGITRNGEMVGVIMTPDRYESIMETIEILSDGEILKKLESSKFDFMPGRTLKDDEVW